MKRLTEVRRAMQRHNGSGPTAREVFKYQTEIPGLKNTSTTLRCSREGLTAGWMAWKRGQTKDRAVEFIP